MKTNSILPIIVSLSLLTGCTSTTNQQISEFNGRKIHAEYTNEKKAEPDWESITSLADLIHTVARKD